MDAGLEVTSGEDAADLARVVAGVPVAIEMCLNLVRHRFRARASRVRRCKGGAEDLVSSGSVQSSPERSGSTNPNLLQGTAIGELDEIDGNVFAAHDGLLGKSSSLRRNQAHPCQAEGRLPSGRGWRSSVPVMAARATADSTSRSMPGMAYWAHISRQRKSGGICAATPMILRADPHRTMGAYLAVGRDRGRVIAAARRARASIDPVSEAWRDGNAGYAFNDELLDDRVRHGDGLRIERVGCAMKVVEPAPHRGALLGAEARPVPPGNRAAPVGAKPR